MPNRRDPNAAARAGPHTIHELPSGLEGLPWELPRVFLGLDGSAATPEGAATWILPVPYEATTCWGSGTRRGPQAIIDASRYVELFDHELGRDASEGGVYTFPALELTRGDAARALAELRDACARVLAAAGDRPVIMVGGEHSVSSPAILAHADRSSERLTVLQFDAHLDLRQTHDGSRHSHACAMAHVVDTVDLVTVGARGISGEEWAVVQARDNVTVITAEEMTGAPTPRPMAATREPQGVGSDLAGQVAGLRPGSAREAPADRAEPLPDTHWIDRTLAALGNPVYITFDVDFFDPSLMPATGTPEPGGGHWYPALTLLRRVFAERRVVGADVVEHAPIPGMTAPDFLVARLIYKFIGYWSEPLHPEPHG